MSRILFAVATAAIVITAGMAQAQDATGKLSLELNKVTPGEGNVCQVVFFGQNGLDTALEEVTWRLAVFDAEGVFSNLLALPLGALSVGKRRVLQFNLPVACTELSEIIVNDVSACVIEGNTDTSNDICLTELEVSSRTDIAFGL